MELADILLSFFVIKACNVSLFYQVKTAGLWNWPAASK
jgi:hypothetical protein